MRNRVNAQFEWKVSTAEESAEELKLELELEQQPMTPAQINPEGADNAKMVIAGWGDEKVTEAKSTIYPEVTDSCPSKEVGLPVTSEPASAKLGMEISDMDLLAFLPTN